MDELPMSPVDRIIRKSGAERVSKEATELLAETLEEEGEKIARKANKLAKHTGRKTIKREDIKMALKEK